MNSGRKQRLIVQLFVGQLILIVVVGLTLIGTDFLLAPSIFRNHMELAGIDTNLALMHITEAFNSAMALSMGIAAGSALIVAVIIAWYLMRRVALPIENLAFYAQALSLGDNSTEVIAHSSVREIDHLTVALTSMADELTKNQEDQARMLRDLAHELRTPISTIGAVVDGIEDGVVQGDAHSWKTIRDQLNRLNRLSKDVRDVSDSYDQPLSTLKALENPLEIGSSAISAWSSRFESKGVLLTLEVDGVIPFITIDPLRIGQILSNLLENALRHTPITGNVVLTISNSGGAISFIIRDSGEGIAPHQLPHIFERLYRADNARLSADAGSGLGLTIARKIAESHTGSLTAMSTGLGHGSTFTLTLPLPRD